MGTTSRGEMFQLLSILSASLLLSPCLAIEGATTLGSSEVQGANDAKASGEPAQSSEPSSSPAVSKTATQDGVQQSFTADSAEAPSKQEFMDYLTEGFENVTMKGDTAGMTFCPDGILIDEDGTVDGAEGIMTVLEKNMGTHEFSDIVYSTSKSSGTTYSELEASRKTAKTTQFSRCSRIRAQGPGLTVTAFSTGLVSHNRPASAAIEACGQDTYSWIACKKLHKFRKKKKKKKKKK